MTRATLLKIGAAFGAAFAGAVATTVAGRAAEARDTSPSQPTISAPALTSADLDALRKHIDERFDRSELRTDKRFDAVNDRIDEIRAAK